MSDLSRHPDISHLPAALSDDAAQGDSALIEQLKQRARRHCRENKIDEAIQAYRSILELQERRVGPRHQSLIETLDNLAQLLRTSGQEPEARELSYRAYCLKS